METITFANAPYIPVLANWLATMRRIERRSVVVYTLDDTTRAFVENSGFEARHVQAGEGIGAFWQMRIRTFRALIETGTRFVHSDADAVWLRDVPDTMFGDGDVCFSQGTTHPRPAFRDKGFVVCCGLFMATPSYASAAFFELLLGNVERTADDQKSVNNVLRRQGIEWSYPEDEYETQTPRGATIRCWESPVPGRSETLGLTTRLLPHWAVQRAVDTHPRAANAYIKHYLSPKTCVAKLKMFERHGLCFLRRDWQEVEAPSSLDDYL